MIKRTLLSIIAIGLILAGLGLPVIAQTAAQISPDQGVGVLSEDPGTGQRWSTSVFPFGNYVGTTSGDDVFCRTYLHFPLDAIPAGAMIQSATLHVYVDDFWPGPGGAPMSTYLVTADWTGADWNDMSTWPTLGGAVSTTDVSSTQGWYTWDVTTLVQDWFGGTPNYGLAVAAADLSSTANDWAAARRLTADDPATYPFLAVIFIEPTPTPTPTATSTPQPPPPPPTATPQPPPPPPRPTATPQPAPTPLPAPSPTPEPILLPETGGDLPWAYGLILLIVIGVLTSHRSASR